MLLDKYGQKMHKSRGNAVEPFTILDKYGADATRWYMLYTSPVWTPLKFDEDGIKEVNSKFINTLKNTYTFFEMYANTDEVDPRSFEVDYKDLEEIDKWLLSKYNNLIKNVTTYMDKYDLNKVVHLIQDFVCDDLSNWYIRRNRRRFWGSTLDNSKKAVYKVTYDVLCGLCKMISPIAPFISEEIYTKLTLEDSVNLSDYPVCNEEYINNELEDKMDTVIDLITIARNLREEAKIKVRQPIQEVIIEGKYKDKIESFTSLIEEEINVKNVVFASNMDEYITVKYKPNFKEVGKLFGSNLGKFTEFLNNISKEDSEKLENGTLKIELDKETEILPSYVLRNIEAKEGYKAVMLNYKTVVLNTNLTNDLINEGLAREIVSKIQNLRKTLDFDISDRINTVYNSDPKVEEAIKQYEQYIKDETLSLTITKGEAKELVKINDYDMYISITKNN